MFNAPNTKANRIAAIIAIVLGLCVGFYISMSSGKGDDEASGQQESVQEAARPSQSVPPALSDILKVSDIDFAAYDKNLARFIGLEMGMPMAEAETKVLEFFTADAGGEGNPVFEMDKLQGYVGGQAFIATIDRMNDDSVKAQQLYAIGKKQSEESFTLVDYGLRVKCWRGDNKDNWQTDLCP